MSACANMPEQTAISDTAMTEADIKQAVKDMIHVIELQADTATAKQLAQDTNEPELAAILGNHSRKLARLAVTLKVAQTKHNANIIAETKAQVSHLQLAMEESISLVYHRIKVPFVKINNWHLLPESDGLLKKQTHAFCHPDHATLVYGYGGYLGSEAATKRVSGLRAKTVAHWIKKNTPCQQTITRGLGIDIRAEEIRNIGMPSPEKEKVLQESRYVRLYVHR